MGLVFGVRFGFVLGLGFRARVRVRVRVSGVERLAEARAHGLHRAEALEAAAEDAVGEAVAEAQVARHLEDEGRLAEAWLGLGLGLGFRVRVRARVRVRVMVRVGVRQP